MLSAIEENREELGRLCERHGVLRLELFGSAAASESERGAGDVDLLVEFAPLSPVEHAEAFFGLQMALENLLGLPVDLIERGPIRNPYLLQKMDHTQVVLYAVA